jgi:ABC-2 type transport system permease protein
MLTLPKGFGQSATRALFGNGERPVIDIRYDPSQAMAMAVVKGLLTQQVMQHVFGGLTGQVGDSAEQVMGEARASVERAAALSPTQRGDLTQMFDSIDKVRKQLASPAATDGRPAQGGFTLRAPFDLKETAAQANPAKGYNSYSQAFAGMSVQFVLFMAIDLGIALLLMRRMGLWKRYRAAPLTRPVLLGASLLSMALIAAAMVTVIFLVGVFAFGVRIEGSVAGFALVIAGFAFLAASLGLLLAALGKTPEATRGLAIFVTLVLMMLGGAWVPSFVFPEWLQQLSLAMPTTWAIEGLSAMTWRGLGLEVALRNTAVLIGFSLVFTLLAMWRFEWEE